MRKLPSNKSPRQNLIIKAVFDFYGDSLKKREYKKARAIALCLMGRKKGVVLDKEQIDNLWFIKNNLQDEIYRNSLADR